MGYDDERNPANPSSPPSEDPTEARRPLERTLPELLRKGIERGLEAGLNTLSKTDGALRGVVADAKLPRELANYLFSQVEDTKKAVLRIVSKEVRDVLHAMDIKRELEQVLSELAIEVHAEIRFRPDKDGALKPTVNSTAAVKKPSAPRSNSP
ncbi:MAG: hypothetical protein H6715_04020 [Myxococcales bacterium]|nr:hypothetical protein [Myxococcales bacterium]MCB9708630.1 hypothetical protein [Myxococcales bacterium]